MTRISLVVILGIAIAPSARADLLEVQIPGTPLVVMLQGGVKYNQGRTVTFTHRLGSIYFSRDSVRKNHKVPTFASLFTRQLGSARDADSAMNAARWALKHGLLPSFYRAVEKALSYDSQHAAATRVMALKRKFDLDLGPYTNEEAHLRKTVRNPNMKVATSKHFVLLHDTPDTPPPVYSKNAKKLKPRAVARLELLEKVYESFLMKFYSQGVELEIPQVRMMVVLFHQERDYLQFATSLSPDLASAIGFYNPRINVSSFYDHGTSEEYKPLRQLSDSLQSRRAEYIKNKDGDKVRLADTLSLLTVIGQENSDIEVVSHEATHQIAGNTGLFPRHVLIPQWVHEGLATYFEAPDEATWSGMGAVNEQRLDWYRALARDRVHSNIGFIVGDQIFKYARTDGAVLHGYGQAWALTHFLLDRHFEEFMTYYQRLGQMPPDITLSPEILTKLFDDTFKTNRAALENEWRSYMASLKTDLEVILGN